MIENDKQNKKKRAEILKICWVNYLLMKKQMKSLNWIARIRQKFNNELTFKRVVIESWQFEFKRKLKMFNYLKEKSVVFIENCKNIEKTWLNCSFSNEYWLLMKKWTIDYRSTNNKVFDDDNEKNINEQMICVQSAKLFENWYVKKQKMMSFCLRTNHRLNDAINC